MEPMIDEHFNADSALALLKEIYLRKGTDAAVGAAKDMISAGAAWIAQEKRAESCKRWNLRNLKHKTYQRPALTHPVIMSQKHRFSPYRNKSLVAPVRLSNHAANRPRFSIADSCEQHS
jgi:hypothetical protein